MKDPEEFWRELLTVVDAGRVIPVIGDLAVTFGAKDTLHSSHIASALAGKDHLKLDPARLPANPTLTDVACEWLVAGHKSSELYKKCNLASQQFDDEKHLPGQALLALASIRKFNLYLTTTFDSLLARAIEKERGQAPAIRGFYPKKAPDEKDLPDKRSQLAQTTVYHLFGQRSPFEGEYVLWEQDVLEFLFSLHATLPTGKGMDLLARELADNVLLIVGLNFSDLLVRLFLRVAKQRSLADLVHEEILAEETPGLGERGNVLLFGGVMKNVYVWRQDPIAFSVELAKRWHAANPALKPAAAAAAANNDMPRGAIFISYAREDEASARALSDALKAHGCVVWYDRERLKPGDYFNEALKEAVERHCSVFLSIVSATTEDAPAGYWRRERKWAIERAPDFSPAAFYIPLWIGGRQPPFVSEPAEVRAGINAVELPLDGTPEFQALLEQVRALQVKRMAVFA
jgi:hypothetical protein